MNRMKNGRLSLLSSVQMVWNLGFFWNLVVGIWNFPAIGGVLVCPGAGVGGGGVGEFEFGLGFEFGGGEFLEGGEAFGGETEFLFAGVEGVFGVFDFLKEEADGGVVVAFDELFASEKNLADGVGAAFDGQILVNGMDELAEAVVYADYFLTFEHCEGVLWVEVRVWVGV